MLRSSWVAAGLLAGVLGVGSPALACKCMLPPVAAARDDATALFEGRVVSIEDVAGASEATNGQRKVTLAVVRTWKGLDREERVTAFTNGSSASCGYTFSRDVSYLVYAREHEGQLSVSGCSRTKPIADAAEDLAVLGAGATPVAFAADASVPKAATPSRPDAAPADGAGTPAAAPLPVKRGGCGSSGAQSAALPFFVALPLFARRRRR